MFLRLRPWLGLIATLAIAHAFLVAEAAADEHRGAYVILEIDTAYLSQQTLELVADEMVEQLRSATPPIEIWERDAREEAVRVQLANAADTPRALGALQGLVDPDSSGTPRVNFDADSAGRIEARLTPAFLQSLNRQAGDQTVEVIRRRLDPTGAEGVTVVRQGDFRILVQAPHIADVSTLRRGIGLRGVLTFHIVSDVWPADAAIGNTPPGTVVVQPYPGIGQSAEVIERRPRLTGARLLRVHPSIDALTREFVLAFEFDDEGARLFCKVTGDHLNRRFAMVLDNQLLTAPRINEPICGGSGQITGNFTAQSANELAAVLSSGALPAPLTVVEEGVAPRVD